MLRLKKEQSLRRLGLFLTVIALVMQAFTVFSPPEQVMASNSGDTVPGGFLSVSQILVTHESNSTDFGSLLGFIGITRNDLLGLDKNPSKICTSDQSITSFSRQHSFSSNEGELTHQVPTPMGISTFYSTPLALNNKARLSNACYKAFTGQSAKIGWFAISASSGNVQIKQSALKFPRGQFISSTCRSIAGNAYDGRQPNQRVKVYLFLGGPPGKGAPYGPITANQQFLFALPDGYAKTSDSQLTIWGAVQPLGDWNEPMVQFDQPITVPTNCSIASTPTASCEDISISLIERSKFKVVASSQAAQGAHVKSYRYIISDSKDHVIFEKSYTSDLLTHTAEAITMPSPGDYSAKVVVDTTVGERSGSQCSGTIHVAGASKCIFNYQLPGNDQDCHSCPYSPGLWFKDMDCVQKIVNSKQVRNLTRSINDANLTTVSPNDRLEYTLYTTNLGDSATATKIEENFTDVLTYGSIIDSGGGNLNDSTKKLSWGSISLNPGQTDIRHVIIQINNSVSSSPISANNLSAYNCSLVNAYGNTTRLKVACPLSKQIESMVQGLPNIGMTGNFLFGTILLLVTSYLYQRSRRLRKEHDLVNLRAHQTLGHDETALLRSAQRHFYGASLTFSSFIHNRFIKYVSEFLSTTLARPRPIIAGSLVAFIVTLALYVTARYIGFALSGSETLLAFFGGWLLGNIYDLYLFTYRKLF
jgi:hypothetical protein